MVVNFKAKMHRNYSILGALLRNAEAAKFRFWNNKSPLGPDFLGFSFPSPVQILMVGQVSKARKLMDDDNESLKGSSRIGMVRQG
jgi:hypothetical protein